MGLDLATIADVVNTEQDPVEALHRHQAHLLDERDRLDRVAATVAATIRHLQEGTDMPAQNLFNDMTPERANYLASLPRKRVAAGALFHDNDGRTLLVAPTYKPHWQLPGGVVDADESPAAAAARSVKRELGLQIALGRLLVVDWVAPSQDRVEGLLFIYDGGVLSSDHELAIDLPPAELRAWAWCTEDELKQRLPEHMLGRTQVALQSRTHGTTGYLENGSTAASGRPAYTCCRGGLAHQTANYQRTDASLPIDSRRLQRYRPPMVLSVK
jgi:ADP-ribose pyrophosphatase YjhB (NUDIX family)